MSFKERLFGTPWESKDADARARSVAGSTDPRLSEKLAEIAASDPEASVRIAALKRMGDETAWLKARDADSVPQIRTAADHFILRSVCEKPAGDQLPDRLAWLEALETSEGLRRVAANAADAEMRAAALGRINSPGFLGDCLVTEPDDAIAETVLARLEQISTLKRIADQLRKKRKSRHQAVIRRLAELESESESGRHDARDELATQLIGQAEKLARGEFSGDRKAESEKLAERWQALADPEPHLARRFEGAMRIIKSALQPRPARTPVIEAVPEAPDAGDGELARMVEQAQAMAAQPAGDKTADALNKLMSGFDRHWNTLRKPSPADEAMRERFRALCGELQARLQTRQKPSAKTAGSESNKSKSGAPTPSESMLELARALDHADQVLAAGDIAQSHEAIRRARSLNDKRPKHGRSDDADGRIARMAGKLKEMRDWQHWSNNKLRERLIERVGEIDAKNLHADAVTERLKELRQRWKELDDHEVLPGDKRKFAAPQGQWRQFQRACKEAFEAARPYLEKRSEVREQSHQELEQFLEDARRVAGDPDAPNDKLIRYQRAAREAIRNLDTLPPKLRGKAAGALRELMDSISASLDRHFEAAENEKRRLIAEARKLAHEKDSAVAIDRAKALQAEWKKVGRGRRKIDEQLWSEFREPIDPLFEDLKKQRDERKQVEHEHAEALKQICARAEELAAVDDPESVTGQVSGLEDEFNRHTAAPPALRKRFERALGRYREQVQAAREEQARAKRAHLDDLSKQLQDTWQSIQDGNGRPSTKDLPDIPEDDEVARRLLARLEQMIESTDIDALGREVEKQTEDARQIVIEMECLSGLDSPEEDRQRRMDYQIDRLSNRLGGGAAKADLDSERAELQRRWLESFPHDSGQASQLKKRFESADKILKQMASG